MIVDKIKVYFRSGKGGDGSSAFKNISAHKKLACGGDGGRGGDISLKVSFHLYDLSKFKGNKKFVAKDGQPGGEDKKHGKNAQNLVLEVPFGTRILEAGKLLADLVESRESFLVCKGGRGGKGNNKRGYILEPGESENKEIIIDYRIPNDIAILGLANSGKTSLFNAICNQNAKVASYPFTTTSCFWAKFKEQDKEPTVLDTPPFKITKSSTQKLENVFLRHIFRSKIIILLSDSKENFKEEYLKLKKEISLFDPQVLNKKKIFYLLAKLDKIDDELKKVQKEFAVKNEELLFLTKNFDNLEELKGLMVKTMKDQI